MELINACDYALRLLDSRQKRKFCFIIFLQVVLPVLDLIGLVLFGLGVAVLIGKSGAIDQPFLELGTLRDLMNIISEDKIYLLITILLVSSLFILKGILSVILSRKLYISLSQISLDISYVLQQKLFKMQIHFLMLNYRMY